MRWTDFNGIAVDIDEIVCVKRGPWSNELQDDYTTIVHTSGQEIKLRFLYTETIKRLRLLSIEKVEA